MWWGTRPSGGCCSTTSGDAPCRTTRATSPTDLSLSSPSGEISCQVRNKNVVIIFCNSCTDQMQRSLLSLHGIFFMICCFLWKRKLTISSLNSCMQLMFCYMIVQMIYVSVAIILKSTVSFYLDFIIHEWHVWDKIIIILQNTQCILSSKWFCVMKKSQNISQQFTPRVTCSTCLFNAMWPSGAIWCHNTWSILVQIMTCCLTATSYSLN